MKSYSIEPRTRKYVRECGFLSFGRRLSDKYGKQLLDTNERTGLDPLKTVTKKVAHKAAEATAEFIGNKIANKVIKPKVMTDENSRNVEKIIFC